MFPIILDVKTLKILLVGNGPATFRRLELLDEALGLDPHPNPPPQKGRESQVFNPPPLRGRKEGVVSNAGKGSITVFADQPIAELKEKAGKRWISRLPNENDFDGAQLVMIADFDNAKTAALAEIARAKGILVNAEDKLPWCDYHVPAIVRRGDLLITVSTGGGSPRLARRLRIWLSEVFSDDWAARLKIIASKRNEWKKQGAGFKELADNTDALIEGHGWFPPCKNTYANACKPLPEKRI